MRRFGKKFFIGAALLAFVIGLPFVLVPALVDSGKVGEQFKAAVKQQTGLDLIIEGKGSASFNNGVTVTFRTVRIPSPPGSYTPNLLSSERVLLRIGLFSALFTDDPKIFAVEFVRPNLTTEITVDGMQSWNAEANGFRGTAYALLKALAFENYLERLTVTKGSVQVSDLQTQTVTKIDDVSFAANYTPAGQESKGDFVYQAKPYHFQTQVSGNDVLSLEAGLTQENSGIEFKGTLGRTKLDGTVTAKTDNIWPWALQFYRLKPRETESAALPLQISGSLEISDQEILYKKLSFEQGGSKGEMTARALYSSVGWAASSKLDFVSLDMDAWLALYHGMLDREKATAKLQPGEALDLLPDDVRAAIELRVAAAKFQNRELTDITAKAELAAGQIVISAFTFTAPGVSRFSGAGVLTERPDGLAFDSGMDVEGKSFRTFAQSWGFIKDLPAELYENFRARFRAFVSASEIRFYEARLKAGETDIGGAVIFYPGTVTKVTAALGIKSINIDALYHTLFPTRDMALSGEEKTAIKMPDFAWLKTTPYQFDGNLRIDDFIFAGSKGSTAAFKLSVTPNLLTLSDITAQYNDMSLAANATVNAATERPEIIMDIVTDKIDFSQLLAVSGYQTGQEALSFPYLRAFQGSVKLAANEFALPSVAIQDAVVDLTLKENALNFALSRGKLWGGPMTATGAVGIDTIPTFALSLAINNFSLADILRFIGGWENYSGRASFSAEIGTSGLTLANWAAGITGNLSLSSRDVTVQGFDLGSVVVAAGNVRAVADIQKVTQADLLAGSTTFSEASGNFPVQNGVIRPDNVRVVTPYSQGKLTGTYSMLTRQADMAVQFPLVSLSTTDTPQLSVVIKGEGIKPAITLDTRSLEAYVARRSAQEMLDKR